MDDGDAEAEPSENTPASGDEQRKQDPADADGFEDEGAQEETAEEAENNTEEKKAEKNGAEEGPAREEGKETAGDEVAAGPAEAQVAFEGAPVCDEPVEADAEEVEVAEPVKPVGRAVARIARSSIGVASTVPDVQRVDTGTGPYYLKEFVNKNAVMGIANGKITTSPQNASGVSNRWTISQVNETGSDPLFTIRCDNLYLAYENAQLCLVGNGGTSAQWHIASYMLEGAVVLAIYHASTGAVLGVPGDALGQPFCFRGSGEAYPNYPASPELRWYAESAEPVAWTIAFNGTGGSGTMNPIEIAGGKESPALVNKYMRTGYTFSHWTDDEGGMYANGATINRELHQPGFVLTLTARWKENTVEVTYSAGIGGSVRLGTSGPAGSRITETIGAVTGIVSGTSARTLSGSTAVANKGYHFAGWSVAGVPSAAAKTGLASGETSSTTLSASTVGELSRARDNGDSTAVYHPLDFASSFTANRYTVDYNANGGTGRMDSTSVAYGTSIALASASALSQDGYSFDGWNTAADGSGVALSNGAVLSTSTLDRLISSGALSASGDDSTTLYAQWKANPVVVPEQGDEPEPEPQPEPQPQPQAVEPRKPESEPVAASFIPVLLPSVTDVVSEVAVENAAATASSDKAPGEALRVTAVSSTPIVEASAVGGSYGSLAGSDTAESFTDALANMTTTETVQVVGNSIMAVAAVSAVAALLGVGVSVIGALAAGVVGVVGTAAATGAADLAAELAAESAVSGGLLKRLRRRGAGAVASDDDGDRDES